MTSRARPMRRQGRSRATARRRFGQHFLAGSWASRIVSALDVQPGDVFLEIGPGHGALTLPLAATGAAVLAVEIDRDLVAALGSRVPSNVTLLTGDVLETDVLGFLTGLAPQRPPSADAPHAARRYRIAGNLPYNVASPILLRLVDWHRRHGLFADATVMVQHEVADRLLAPPGRKAYGALTVFVQLHAHVSRVLNLPPGAFSPPPKVRSTVLRLDFGPAAARVTDEALFERVVKGLFSARRKTLRNAMRQIDPAGEAALTGTGLDPRRRPETLDIGEFALVAERLAALKRQPVL